MPAFKVNLFFYHFCKNWRMVKQIFCFFIFLFNVTTKGSWMILFKTGLFAYTAHPNIFFFEIVANYGVRYCTYICYFGLRMVFNHVPDDTTPHKTFFLFSIILPLTSSFIFFFFEGWLIIPTPLQKTANIADTLLSWSHILYLYLLFWAAHGF